MLLERLRHAYRCRDLARARARLQAWYRLPLGRSLAAMERAQLKTVLPNLFGYHLIQLGSPFANGALTASRVSHAAILHVPGTHAGRATHRLGNGTCPGRLRGDADRLPFCSGSIDVMVLPHTLEFERRPHEVLREVDRVLIPEGHAVFLGFSPWSLWGVWRLLFGWCGITPWCGRLISARRLKDWLELLGFDTIVVRGYFFRPPFRPNAVLRRLRFLEYLGRRWWPVFGNGYMLVARKRVVTLTPIRPRWRPRRNMVPTGIRPSVRGQSIVESNERRERQSH